MFDIEKIALLKEKKHLLEWCLTHATSLHEKLAFRWKLQKVKGELKCLT